MTAQFGIQIYHTCHSSSFSATSLSFSYLPDTPVNKVPVFRGSQHFQKKKKKKKKKGPTMNDAGAVAVWFVTAQTFNLSPWFGETCYNIGLATPACFETTSCDRDQQNACLGTLQILLERFQKTANRSSLQTEHRGPFHTSLTPTPKLQHWPYATP
jgi:hypothetical protein